MKEIYAMILTFAFLGTFIFTCFGIIPIWPLIIIIILMFVTMNKK